MCFCELLAFEGGFLETSFQSSEKFLASFELLKSTGNFFILHEVSTSPLPMHNLLFVTVSKDPGLLQ